MQAIGVSLPRSIGNVSDLYSQSQCTQNVGMPNKDTLVRIMIDYGDSRCKIRSIAY
jgi:hypothetical protein